MDILFIHSIHNNSNPTKPLGGQNDIPYGISYLSAFLNQHGHNVKLLVLNRANKELIHKYVDRHSPSIIGFSPVASEYPFIARIAQRVKERHPDIFLLAGGPHITLNPETCITDGFDAICVGEGERPLLELVQQMEKGQTPAGIANLWIKQDGTVEKNPTRPFLRDLDELPFPDREMWQEWIMNPFSTMLILLGRGCPFDCTYCCNHALREIAPGPYVRLRSPASAMREIEETSHRFPWLREIFLEVETFGIDVKWAMELAKKLAEFNAARAEPIAFGANLRITPKAELDEFFVSLKKGNFKYIKIGLESGSEQVRRKILKRFESNADIIKAVRLAKKYGIEVGFYNMIGIPGETLADFRETVNLNRLCSPDFHSTAIFFPYPGTALYALCREWGLVDKPLDPDRERERATLDLPGFPKRQIQHSYIWFDYHVYRGHKPIYRLLPGVLGRWLRANFPTDRFYLLTIFGYLRWLKSSLNNLLRPKQAICCKP